MMNAICTEKPLPPQAALSQGSSILASTLTWNSTVSPLGTTSNSVMSKEPGV
jgi:hypothetical protein